MVDINDKIEKLGKYFVSFNIADGVAYALVRFPNSWDVPTEIDQYSVKTVKKGGEGIYFFSESKDGIGNIFKAIDSVIALNKEFEERKRLLSEKAQELKELFVNEPLDKLKNLTFTFVRPKKVKKPKEVVTVTDKPSSEPLSLVDEVLETIEKKTEEGVDNG